MKRKDLLGSPRSESGITNHDAAKSRPGPRGQGTAVVGQSLFFRRDSAAEFGLFRAKSPAPMLTCPFFESTDKPLS